jgi:hypothetical protein
VFWLGVIAMTAKDFRDGHHVLELFRKRHPKWVAKLREKTASHAARTHNPNNRFAMGTLIRVKHVVIALGCMEADEAMNVHNHHFTIRGTQFGL